MAFIQTIEMRTEPAELAERQTALLEGPPSFADLDVVEDRT